MVCGWVQAEHLASLAGDYASGTAYGQTTESIGLQSASGHWNFYSTSTTDPSTWTTSLLQWGKVIGATRNEPGYVTPPVNTGTGIGANNSGISSLALFTGEPQTPVGFLYFHPHNNAAYGTVAQWTAGPVDPEYPRLMVDLELRKADTETPVTLWVYHNETNVYTCSSMASTTTVTAACIILSYAEGDTLSFVLENAGSSANDGTFISAEISSIPEPPSDQPAVTLGGELGRRREIQKEYLWRYQTGSLRNHEGFLDFEADLIGYFTNRLPRATVGETVLCSYAGIGKAIDAAVQYAHSSGDTNLVAQKDRWIDLIINSQDDDGYFGMVQREDNNVWYLRGWVIHDGAYICLALLENYALFDHGPSLASAKRFVDFVMPRWQTGVNCSPIGITEALLRLYELTGSTGYLDSFADVAFDGRFIDEESVREWRQYLYPPDNSLGPTQYKVHTYRYFARCIEQLDLNQIEPNDGLNVMTDYGLGKMRDLRLPGMFISGATGRSEGWVEDQDGRGGIGEACAVVHQIWMLSRLIEQRGDLAYGDLMERMILNHMCAAQNAEESDGRSRYFAALSGARSYNKGAHCCEGNTRRFWAQLPGQVFYVRTNSVAVNLYTPSEINTRLVGTDVMISQITDYPRSGSVSIQVDPSAPVSFALDLRIPEWAAGHTVSVNGSPASTTVIDGGVRISRVWNTGDAVELTLPMDWRWLQGHGYYEGRYALMRGPQVFCVSRDHNPALDGIALSSVVINPDSFTATELPGITSNRNGQAVQVTGELPAGGTVPVLFTDFPEENGEETYFPLSDTSGAVEDELYQTVDLYPQMEVIEAQENPPLAGLDDFSGGSAGESLGGAPLPGSALTWSVVATGCEFDGSGGATFVDGQSTTHAHVTAGDVLSRVWIEADFCPADPAAFTVAGRINLGMGNGYNRGYWAEDGRDTLTVCMAPLTGDIRLQAFDVDGAETRTSGWADYGAFEPAVNTPQSYRMRLEYDPESSLLSAVLSNLVTATAISNTLDTTGMTFTLNTFGFELIGVQPADAKPYLDSFAVQQSGSSRIPDADNDGMPTAWEEQAGLFRDFNDADQDRDRDGFSNFEEYLADTDPLDAGSQLRIKSLFPEDDGLILQWSGGSNAVQYIDFLANGDTQAGWTNLMTLQPPVSKDREQKFSYTASSGWFRIRAGR